MGCDEGRTINIITSGLNHVPPNGGSDEVGEEGGIIGAGHGSIGKEGILHLEGGGRGEVGLNKVEAS